MNPFDQSTGARGRRRLQGDALLREAQQQVRYGAQMAALAFIAGLCLGVTVAVLAMSHWGPR